jgi:nitroreductase
MEATKTATRDYPSFSRTPWGLWEVMYARRSSRKYLQMQLQDEFVHSFENAVQKAITTRGAGEDSLLVVTNPEQVTGIRKRAGKGLHGKINFWLSKNPVCGFLVMVAHHDDVNSERPEKTPLAAMAAEDSILWLTENGMGTCWLGGFNQVEVRKVLSLDNDMAVPAIIPLGKPKPKVQARDFDNLLYRRISRHRKPLSDIAYMEDMNHPYDLPDLTGQYLSASATQDIIGLLEQLAGETSGNNKDVPLELALDACLEAARIAPSASNAQLWQFVVVSEKEKLGDLAKACDSQDTWSAAIVGAGQTGRMDTVLEKPFWMIDLPIALSHISLMAASMDLAVDLCLNGIDEKAVNGMVKLRYPLRSVGVVGIR